MTEDQRTILHDAITTAQNFRETFRITDKNVRELEQREFLNRIIDDIRTVISRS